jgi:hypothetical protein
MSKTGRAASLPGPRPLFAPHLAMRPTMTAARRAPLALIALIMLAAGCGPRPEPTPGLSKRIDAALIRGVGFLASRRDAGGLWRSDVYGSFKDPSALTPLVLNALEAANPSTNSEERGLDFLTNLTRPDGNQNGLTYPLYTAALTVNLLSAPLRAAHAKARPTWTDDLASRQLDEKLGWQPSDLEFGGWGYAKDLPRKPAAGLHVLPGTESNLSATTFALEALRQTGAGNDVFRKARVFLDRCQNHSAEDHSEEAPFNDGGFYFIPNDSVRNKAGSAGKDAAGRERYASYGSATADGIRSLIACGVPETDPRLLAARRWLDRFFRADTHPGAYAADREINREAVYFYYTFSVSRALRSTGDDLIRREQLAEALLSRQGPDGAWVNSAVAVREDDPLVATSFAVLALAACRDALSTAAGASSRLGLEVGVPASAGSARLKTKLPPGN